jgi:hypothetical protein
MRINEIFDYFDLQSQHRGDQAQAGAPRKWVFPQYLMFVLGIAVQPYLATYQSTGHIDLDLMHFGKRVAVGLVLGLLFFPGAYKSIKTTSPINFIDICLIFSSGVTWQTLAGSAQKAALGL